MRIALTRAVSAHLDRCELTHLPRVPLDVELARRQHRAYERCLAELGCEVRRLPAEPELADAVFIEDTAVVLDELAVIARPGAASRRAETTAVADALRALRPLHAIEAPATLDGGDVLRVGRTLDAVALYARGMTTRDIQGYLQDLYSVEVSPQLISDVTDAPPSRALTHPAIGGRSRNRPARRRVFEANSEPAFASRWPGEPPFGVEAGTRARARPRVTSQQRENVLAKSMWS